MLLGASHIGDKLLKGRCWPLKGQAAEELSHWQFLDLVTGQFEGTLAADARVGIVGEGGEAIDLLENSEVEANGFNAFKAAEGFVVLSEDADDLFGGVVGRGNESTFNGIDQAGPMAFEKGKDGFDCLTTLIGRLSICLTASAPTT